MIVGRIVLGVGVGGAAAIAPLFITETGPTAVRGRCIGVKCVTLMSALCYQAEYEQRLLYSVRAGGFRGYRCWGSRHEKWLASPL